MELVLLISNIVLDFLLLVGIILLILFIIIAAKYSVPDEDDFFCNNGKGKGKGKTPSKK